MSIADIDIKELILRRSTPVVINCFNQLSYIRNIVGKLREAGFGNLYVLDQASTYPPLRQWLEEERAKGSLLPLYLPKNQGPHYFFLAKLYDFFGGVPFVYTDPDLSWNTLAPDFLTRMFDIAHRYRVFKVGPALSIPADDELKPGLISTHNGPPRTVPEYEAAYWRDEIEPGVYNAPIDTTMHLFIPHYYEPNTPLITGLRVAGPGYSVLHLPWFTWDPMPSDEHQYYLQHSSYTTWLPGNGTGPEDDQNP